MVQDTCSVDVVLVSVDGSDRSMEAARYAVAIAARYGASVHALFVLDDELQRALDRGRLETDAVAAYGADCIEHLETLAEREDVALSVSSARGFTERRLGQHPGTVVLETADAVGADFIVLPRDPGVDEPIAVLEKAAQYVLAYASQPVLSV